MPAIDEKTFAKECVRQAVKYGVLAHYLVAVAKLRSGINDDKTNDQFGPFVLTTNEWEANRRDSTFGLDFDTDDISDWRAQCVVFADMVHWALAKKKTEL